MIVYDITQCPRLPRASGLLAVLLLDEVRAGQRRREEVHRVDGDQVHALQHLRAIGLVAARHGGSKVWQ
jgi:hypothetical protein